VGEIVAGVGVAVSDRDQAVTQDKQRLEQVTPGFEELARVVAQLLQDLPAVLYADDRLRAGAAAGELLGEVRVGHGPDA
jgi:hypothetical protein